MIYSNQCQNILTILAKRKASINELTFTEVSVCDTEYYQVVNKMTEIGEELWKMVMEEKIGSQGFITILQHRFMFLYTVSAIARGESILDGKLSKLSYFELSRNEPTPIQVMVLKNTIGKSNRGRILLGRVIRYKDPNLCPLNALAMYLFFRFDFTEEYNKMNPSDNESWFNNIIIVDIRINKNIKNE